jgi:NAD(P)-dependent dehydrogenase (short-subunit alcohol dehydrogenase family)
MNRFVGKRALVTGTGSGIGQAVAKRLASEGAIVACLDIAGHQETTDGITAEGGSATAWSCDVSDAVAVEAVVTSVAEALGGIDVVCNIAGIGHFAKSEEETPEWWNKIIGVNLTGTFLVSRYALPHLLASGGNIVNTASNAGLMGQPWSAAYCASKGGVVMLTKALAFEYQDQGVRVNAVAPGGTATNITNSFGLPEGVAFKRMHRMMSPMGMAEPSDIANAFAYIASDEAKFMTGSIVSVDGGLIS